MNHTEQTNGFVISKSGDHFLCSHPGMLPTFTVRHDSPENARALMNNVLDHFRGSPLSVPAKAGVDIQHVFIEEFKNQAHLMNCPNLLPGLWGFGSTIDQALAALNNVISRYFETIPRRAAIRVESCYNGYKADCAELLPHITRNAIAPEQAFNEMAATLTEHSIKAMIQQQALSPIIVTGAFHSGTSAVALLLIKNGICMGTQLNYAYDEQDISTGIPGVGPFMGLSELITRYYPDRQHHIAETELLLLRDYFLRLIASKVAYPRWGWKAPPNIFLMPMLSRVFPEAKFIQIVRDGRDVALSPHSEFPNSDFGRLIYFDRTDIQEWQGIPLTAELGKGMGSNKFDPPPGLVECSLFAYLWQKMSLLGAKYGETLGNRFLLIRYEDLCLEPEKTVARIADFLNVPLDHKVIHLKKDRIHKFRTPPAWASDNRILEAIEKNAREGLDYFGYC